MHRNPAPRLLGCWSLVLGLGLLAGPPSASAQQVVPVQPVPLQPVPVLPAPSERIDVPVMIMTTGTTQVYTSKDNLKSVVNPNAKVLNVQRVANKYDQVMFEAIAPGRTKVTLVDVKDRIESVEVVVISDRVKELRDMIQRSVPTASVIVNSTDSGNAVVLTGTVLSTEDARVIQQIAAQLFGVNVVNNVHIGGVQQVQLEVIVAVVNRSEARTMSFSFVENTNKAFISSVFGPASFASALATSSAASTSSVTASGANIPFGVLRDNNGFFGYLQALRTEGLAKVLAEPRITTLSGRPASIVSGGETPILTSSGVGAPSVSYKQFGTVVNFLPIVLGNGKIHLEVRPEISDLNLANGITIPGAVTTVIPGFTTRSVQVAVQMEDGQTLAIGGLIQNKVNASISRVPVLGDLPYLGVLFTSKTITENEEELVILVTPRLVDPIDCTKIPHYLPGRETRVPDDFEFFLEGILEAPRGQRTLGLHPRSLHGAYKNSPSVGQYPCNDATGCHGRGGCATGSCATGGCATGGCATGSCANGNHANGNQANGNQANVNQANVNQASGNYAGGNGATGQYPANNDVTNGNYIVTVPGTASTQEGTMIPSGHRISVTSEASIPLSAPQSVPTLGPAVSPAPMPSAREGEPRSAMPPASFGPAGPH